MNLQLKADNLVLTKKAVADIRGPKVTGQLTLHEYQLDGACYVHVRAELEGDRAVLTPGQHAVHFHERAACDCEGFKCAGGHFDPGPFGSSDPDLNHGYHAGDLPSITIDEAGHGVLEAITTRVTLSDGPVSLLGKASAPEGTSIMIHAGTDSFSPGEQGSGKSGGPRLACGTINEVNID
jgi:Cu-Zn family superoxide dismutase